MDRVAIAHPYLHVPDSNDIDGAFLITELASGPSAAIGGIACVTAPPLTLYGAYRQGFDDHRAGRANPYRAGSRLAGVWYEGYVEAVSGNPRR